MKQYVITSPPFEVTSGGVRVLYGLLGYLLAKGQIAFINQKLPNMETIAIYPEIQQGDPLKAEKVIRYVLNKPGVVPALMSDGSLKYGPTEFDPKDELFYFSRLYGETEENYYMFLPILDLHTFKDQKKKRTKTCYFVGKGVKDLEIEKKFIHPKDAILIERGFAQDQSALADLLNECKVMYCYDPNSAMTEVARLCGVRIIYVNPLYTKDEFEKYEPGMNGISWDFDEGIELDVNAFREHYKKMVRDFSLKIDWFIEHTQNEKN